MDGLAEAIFTVKSIQLNSVISICALLCVQHWGERDHIWPGTSCWDRKRKIQRRMVHHGGETNHEGNRNMGEKVRARKGVLETCPVSENNVRQEKKSTGLIERKNNQHTEYI